MIRLHHHLARRHFLAGLVAGAPGFAGEDDGLLQQLMITVDAEYAL
jgi:hypothetical protein